MAPHSSTLAWKIPWTEDLVGCSPWDREELDTTERLHFHFSLSCIGEGNGNPLQCSCLENPRDEGAWWAAVYGVAQSQTRLKWLSSSSSSSNSSSSNPLKNITQTSTPTDKSKKSSLNSTMKVPLCPFLISSFLLLSASPSNQIVVVIQVNIFAPPVVV